MIPSWNWEREKGYLTLLPQLIMCTHPKSLSHSSVLYAVVPRRLMSSVPGGSGQNIFYVVLCGGALAGSVAYVSLIKAQTIDEIVSCQIPCWINVFIEFCDRVTEQLQQTKHVLLTVFLKSRLAPSLTGNPNRGHPRVSLTYGLDKHILFLLFTQCNFWIQIFIWPNKTRVQEQKPFTWLQKVEY